MASIASSTRTKTKKAAGVINQAVEETSSEEEEDEDERGAANTKACIEHLMTLGQGHIGVNVGLKEDCDNMSGYGFMKAPMDPAMTSTSGRSKAKAGPTHLRRGVVARINRGPRDI